MALTDDDLEPYTSSGYAWRWNDPKYAVLPDAALKSIKTLRRQVARAQFEPSLEVDHWVRERPDRTVHTDTMEEEAVSGWLNQGGSSSDVVIASWSEDEAIYLPWPVFTRYWSSFCYPASDDVTVWPLTNPWALSYDYIGAFHWRSRVEQSVV